MSNLNTLSLTDLKNHQPPYLETIYSLANGHFGIRASDPIDPSPSSGTLVNGYYETDPIVYGESAVGYAKNHQTIVNLPDLRQITVTTSTGKAFDRSTLKSSNLNFETGILSQDYVLSTDDDQSINLHLTTVIDQADQTAVALRYEFTKNSYVGKIKVTKSLQSVKDSDASDDPRKARQVKTLQFDTTVDTANEKNLVIKTVNSKLTITMAISAFSGTLTEQVFNLSQENGVATYLAGVSNIDYDQKTPVIDLSNYTFDSIAESSRQYWSNIWHSSQVEIDSDDQLTQAIRYNLFQLNQSAGRDGKTNIPAKGLSGTGYEGHYFWDTEMYLLPYFTYTDPEIARDLLDFRFNTLDDAKKQARTLGVDHGALFPWRTINGQEASAYYPAGTAQYHIDGDIAYAVNRYYEATVDNDWLIKKGFELVLETARFWVNFGHFREIDHQKRFEFAGVTGPNEYTVMVDNNYYTNRIAKHNLNLAVRLGKIVQALAPEKFEQLNVTDKELDDFFSISQAIYLPFNKDLKINAQDDSFFSKPLWPFETTPKENYPLLLHYHPLTIYRHQVAKQADTILAEFLFPEDTKKDHLKREYDYYEKITTHDSSLSRSVFSMVAARLNDYKQAYQYFMATATMDLTDLQGNTEDGLHLSNLGGSWLALTAGFAGMTQENGILHLTNNLPKQWNALTFRIRLQNNLFKVTLTHDNTNVELLEGPEAKVFISGKEHTVSTFVTEK
ncbi:glycoside hydrolase family 65 protein [Companilactobacillus zhongbaensis]|uniref:glycoside hydrolase family 65 protein n=1 Tax=Companilactobacillus zhongbaensis TaxID=2486009 RepID=UPI000F7BAE78|nr:glycosyl hydrolase family 65 protein [Companilactobacillus zhongbaensis]